MGVFCKNIYECNIQKPTCNQRVLIFLVFPCFSHDKVMYANVLVFFQFIDDKYTLRWTGCRAVPRNTRYIDMCLFRLSIDKTWGIRIQRRLVNSVPCWPFLCILIHTCTLCALGQRPSPHSVILYRFSLNQCVPFDH